ncbi:YveK family protein [Aeromicrobium ginsengisoli]|uniref:YveK family protein n=1 Tax=Aeromicrobium ginsengisoli TaxID=363867 RepID=UPI00165FE383|nr:Wzz/FepE/Etk N-terminal domain-containing protein [Aeromicrobium ginsengisoli]
MHPYDYFHALRRGWPILVVATICGLLAAIALSALTTTQYTATTRIYFTASGGAKGEDLSNAAQYALARVQGFDALARSSTVLDPVAAESGGTVSAGQLAGQVSVSTSMTTTMVDVSVADTSAKRAATLSEAVSTSLIKEVDVLERPSKDSPASMTGTIVSPAQVPSAPSSPNWTVNLLAGLVIGAMIGSGVVATREFSARARVSDRAGT